jgi:hypothetical protein
VPILTEKREPLLGFVPVSLARPPDSLDGPSTIARIASDRFGPAQQPHVTLRKAQKQIQQRFGAIWDSLRSPSRRGRAPTHPRFDETSYSDNSLAAATRGPGTFGSEMPVCSEVMLLLLLPDRPWGSLSRGSRWS